MAKVLGIAPSSSYELMHEPEFPTLRIGNRMVVPKEKFISVFFGMVPPFVLPLWGQGDRGTAPNASGV